MTLDQLRVQLTNLQKRERHRTRAETKYWCEQYKRLAIAALEEPTAGSWIAAEDVHRMVRQIDVALNGEFGAAKQAMLCDITAQVVAEARKRGGPLLLVGTENDPMLNGDPHDH